MLLSEGLHLGSVSWKEAASSAMGPSSPVLQWAEAFPHPEAFANSCPIATEMSADCKCLTSAKC